MPASTFPYVTGDPVLRTCRGVTVRRLAYKIKPHRVAQPSMCLTHKRTCVTCCSLLNRRCGLEPREVAPQPKFTDAEREERDADLAQIRNELGFRPETDAEIAENVRWRMR